MLEIYLLSAPFFTCHLSICLTTDLWIYIVYIKYILFVIQSRPSRRKKGAYSEILGKILGTHFLLQLCRRERLQQTQTATKTIMSSISHSLCTPEKMRFFETGWVVTFKLKVRSIDISRRRPSRCYHRWRSSFGSSCRHRGNLRLHFCTSPSRIRSSWSSCLRRVLWSELSSSRLLWLWVCRRSLSSRRGIPGLVPEAPGKRSTGLWFIDRTSRAKTWITNSSSSSRSSSSNSWVDRCNHRRSSSYNSKTTQVKIRTHKEISLWIHEGSPETVLQQPSWKYEILCKFFTLPVWKQKPLDCLLSVGNF